MKLNFKDNPIITPISSIFGSGFLIIVPILASVVGVYSFFAMLLVCAIAYLVGSVIRFNIKNIEPLLTNNTASKYTKNLDHISDILLIPAYIISVTLYLKILSSFALTPFSMYTEFNTNLLVTIILIFILLIDYLKGLEKLSFLESISLIVTFMIIGLLLIGFFNFDIHSLQKGFNEPLIPKRPLLEKIEIIAGTLIVVQGFETTRYLGYKYSPEVRIKASKDAQILSTIVYLLFILAATPLMFSLNLSGTISNSALITLTNYAAPILVIPLIFAAMLSQFSASIADTFAASGNIEELSNKKISVKKGTLIVIIIAIILTWLVGSEEFVALASKAFAIYYLFQCFVAISVAKTKKQKILFIPLVLILSFIVLFSIPAG